MSNKDTIPTMHKILYPIGGVYTLIGGLIGCYKMAVNRYECIEEGGMGGFFWCPDSVYESASSIMFKAFAWPFYI